MNNTKIITGLDLLKFIMCVMIVSIHTNGFARPDWLNKITDPLVGQAVPVFFVISGFLFFRRLFNLGSDDRVGGGRLLHFTKRLLILYLFWFVLWLPLIIKDMGFMKDGLGNGIGLFLHDFLVGSTFHGSWYLSSLLLSVIILWFLHQLHVGILVLPLSLFLYGFLEHMYLGELYYYLQSIFRPELTMTFISGIVWAGIGYCLALPSLERKYTLDNNLVFLFIYLLFYIIQVLTHFNVITLITVPLVFIIFHNLDLSPNPIYNLMRKTSTIVFLFHFIVVVAFKHLINNQALLSGPLYLLIVFSISLLTAWCLVRLSECRYLGWLKYAY